MKFGVIEYGRKTELYRSDLFSIKAVPIPFLKICDTQRLFLRYSAGNLLPNGV
jgi:hypothetical protein